MTSLPRRPAPGPTATRRPTSRCASAGSTGARTTRASTRFLLFCLFCLYCFASCEGSAPTISWRGRSIYFVVTDRFAKEPSPSAPCDGRGWCGGTFRGVMSKLDYIQAMGFDAVWITPVVQQVPWLDNYNGTGYHGYWAANFSNIDPHLGTRRDLRALSDALHARGMLLMLDVVANHVGPITHAAQLQHLGAPLDVPARFHTLERQPGESFDQYVGHPCNALNSGCMVGNMTCPGYNQTRFEQCWFYSLADLKHEDPTTAAFLRRWVHDLVAEFAVDGLRLDTAPYVPQSFLAGFRAAAGVYITGEVTSFNASFHASYERVLGGALNFPLTMLLPHKVFGGEAPSFAPLAAARRAQLDPATNYSDLNLLCNFVDNHDGARFLLSPAQGDRGLLRNALTWAFFLPGIPILYYGTEQAFAQVDERTSLWPHYADAAAGNHMYAFVARLNGLRRSLGVASDYSMEVTHVADESRLVFSRGATLVVITNHRSADGPPRGGPCVPPAVIRTWVDRVKAGHQGKVCNLTNALAAPSAVPKGCDRITWDETRGLCLGSTTATTSDETCTLEPAVIVAGGGTSC